MEELKISLQNMNYSSSLLYKSTLHLNNQIFQDSFVETSTLRLKWGYFLNTHFMSPQSARGTACSFEVFWKGYYYLKFIQNNVYCDHQIVLEIHLNRIFWYNNLKILGLLIFSRYQLWISLMNIKFSRGTIRVVSWEFKYWIKCY